MVILHLNGMYSTLHSYSEWGLSDSWWATPPSVASVFPPQNWKIKSWNGLRVDGQIGGGQDSEWKFDENRSWKVWCWEWSGSLRGGACHITSALWAVTFLTLLSFQECRATMQGHLRTARVCLSKPSHILVQRDLFFFFSTFKMSRLNEKCSSFPSGQVPPKVG